MQAPGYAQVKAINTILWKSYETKCLLYCYIMHNSQGLQYQRENQPDGDPCAPSYASLLEGEIHIHV